jgi:60 kDa SS-A/Ro ribonucleoprotein
MALITAASEPNYDIVTFATSIKPVSVSPRMRLDQVYGITARGTGEGTDCSLPIRYALSHNLKPEAFVIYTDSQSWYGNQHPIEALWEYRRKTGIPAKLINVNMVANEYSLVATGTGKDDALTMNAVGFDASVPQLISDFVAG